MTTSDAIPAWRRPRPTVLALASQTRLFVVAVVAGGVVVIGTAVPEVSTWTRADALGLAVLAGAVVLLERFQIELVYRRERVNYALSDAVWTAGLLLAKPSALILAVAVGVAVGQGSQAWSPVKVAFNVGQFLLGIGAAVIVFATLGSPAATEPRAWLAAALGMAAFQVVNTTAVGLIISLTERAPFRNVALVPTALLHWVGNIAVGVLGALLWELEPGSLVLLGIPVVLTYGAYQGWLRSLQEAERMQSMARAAETISAGGDLTRRLPDTSGAGEVGTLSVTLNRMLARLEGSFSRERLFISETSHELRTPITICRGHLELLGPDPSTVELSETVGVVVDELDRMARIVSDMGTLARMEDPASLHLDDVPLDRLVAEVAAKAAPLLDGQLCVGVIPPHASVRGDAQRLTQALINLLHNAKQHTPAATVVSLDVVAEPQSWRFEVADNGGGLPAGQEEAMFRPFSTGLRSGGSGLGLAIILGIARAHGGSAGVDNRPGVGATFWVRVPR